MAIKEDPRKSETRNHALEKAIEILQKEGVLAVTHATISKQTGISRSTLYRHWPEIHQLRNDAFKRAAIPEKINQIKKGELRADLRWLLSTLLTALNETAWGQIAPQVISVAATDKEIRKVMNNFMEERMGFVEELFIEAEFRGELRPNVQIRQLVELAIAVPYFRKFNLGANTDSDWLESHVEMICQIAEKIK
jgi:AcrR family transcriptional regulator